MSAISGYINNIQNAVYGEQVRSSIIGALEQCYADVNSPSLQSAAFSEALNAAYAEGILDIQTVTTIAGMTNQQIIYRYNGTEAGKQKGLYYYSALASGWVLIGSEIQSVSNSNQFTDQDAIYKYTGNQTGMVTNSLYCYNGTAWVPIGSGVLNAATASEMTNTGAIYKYTGSESGYITNGLYYYNGTAWTLLSLDTIVGDLADLNTISRDTVVSAINEVNDNNLTEPQKLDLLALLKNAVYTTPDANDRYNSFASAFGLSVDYNANPFVGNTYENRGKYIRNTDGVEDTNANTNLKYFISDEFTADTCIYVFPFLTIPLAQGVTSFELFAYTKKSGLYSSRVHLVNISAGQWAQQFYIALSKDFTYKIVICLDKNSAINDSAAIEAAMFANVKPLINESGYNSFTISGLSDPNTWTYSSASDRYYIKLFDEALNLQEGKAITHLNSISFPSNLSTSFSIPVYYPIPASIGNYDSNKIRAEQVIEANSNRITALTITSGSFTKTIAILQQQGVDSITFNERVF